MADNPPPQNPPGDGNPVPAGVIQRLLRSCPYHFLILSLLTAAPFYYFISLVVHQIRGTKYILFNTIGAYSLMVLDISLFVCFTYKLVTNWVLNYRENGAAPPAPAEQELAPVGA